jgi:ankyrin repeat protein
MSMIRAFFVPLPALAFAIACTAASAQQPPSDREIAVYAGLHAAAAEGDTAEIEKLIRDGEPPNIQDSRSRTPLHVAAYRKHHKAVEALLRLGANPNMLDLQRFDVVTIAAVQNDLDLLKIALAGGAKPDNVTTNSDANALINAAHLGHVEIVRTLVEAHTNLDHVNRGSWTALIVAVVLGNGGKNYLEIVEMLVKAGADGEIKDRQGMTALAHARARRYEDMVKILAASSGRKT